MTGQRQRRPGLEELVLEQIIVSDGIALLDAEGVFISVFGYAVGVYPCKAGLRSFEKNEGEFA